MKVIGQHSWKDPQFRKDANFLRCVPRDGIRAMLKPQQGPRQPPRQTHPPKKKNVTLNLKLSDARNVCSHLSETYSHNGNRDLSRVRAVRKLQGVIARAEQVNKGAE